LEFEAWIVLAMTLDDGGEFVLAAVSWEGVFHVAHVEAVVVFTEGFTVHGAVAAPVAHATDFLDIFQDSYAVEFGDTGWTKKINVGRDGRYA
jgi:hypothetical protein